MVGEQHSVRDTVIDDLTRSARKRWAALGLGLALLALLFIFAGTIRSPGARKNPHIVIASRVLVVVAAVMLTRIVLLTNEDGTPVFLVECGAEGGLPADALGLIGDMYEVVPLSDVVAFVRDQRYVPGKGAAVVIEVNSRDELVAAAAALGEGDRACPLPVTLLLGESVVAEIAGAGAFEVPAEISLAVRAPGATDDEVIAAVKSVSGALQKATGRPPEYAFLEGDEGLGLGKIGKATGIEAFFGGDGLNRYGDRGNRIRLADISGMLAAGGCGTRLRVYTAMYRGNYVPYPVWVWLEKTSPVPGKPA